MTHMNFMPDTIHAQTARRPARAPEGVTRGRWARRLAATAFLAAAPLLTPAVAATQYVIGTNPVGSVYYTVGTNLAKLISDKLDIRSTVQPYSGSSIYLPLVNQGQLALGVSSALDGGLAFNGKADFRKLGQQKDLRTLVHLWNLSYTYVARANSGMQTIADLKGKKVAVGISSNVSLGLADEAYLKAGGVDPEKDIKAVTIGGLDDGFNKLQNGSIDATVSALGIPLMEQAHNAIPGGVTILDLTGPDANSAFLDQQMSGLYLMPQAMDERYPYVKKDLNITGFDVFLVGSSHLAENDVYDIVKAIHTNWPQLQKDNPALRKISQNDLSSPSNTIPYADGAIRFFKEIGQWTDENEAREKAF